MDIIKKLKDIDRLAVALTIESTLATPNADNVGILFGTLIGAIATRFPTGIDKELAERIGKAVTKCLVNPGSCKEEMKKLADELFEEAKEANYELSDSEEWLQLVDELFEKMREAFIVETRASLYTMALAQMTQWLGVNPMNVSEEKIAKELRKRGLDPAKVLSEIKKMKKELEENGKRLKELKKELKVLEEKATKFLS